MTKYLTIFLAAFLIIGTKPTTISATEIVAVPGAEVIDDAITENIAASEPLAIPTPIPINVPLDATGQLPSSPTSTPSPVTLPEGTVGQEYYHVIDYFVSTAIVDRPYPDGLNIYIDAKDSRHPLIVTGVPQKAGAWMFKINYFTGTTDPVNYINQYTLIINPAITEPPLLEQFVEENGFWYCYIDGEKQIGYFTTSDGQLRYSDPLNGGALGYGFLQRPDGRWIRVNEGGVVQAAGFYQAEGDIYWRAYGEEGLLYVTGFHEFADGTWRYILNGAIIAPVGFHDEVDGITRLVLDGGLIAPPGIYEVEGVTYNIGDGGVIIG